MMNTAIRQFLLLLNACNAIQAVASSTPGKVMDQLSLLEFKKVILLDLQINFNSFPTKYKLDMTTGIKYNPPQPTRLSTRLLALIHPCPNH